MINKKYRFGTSVFVCSKPLQFFHLVSIAKDYSIDKPKLYIVTRSFFGWEDFKVNILSSKFKDVFSAIIFCDSYDTAAESIVKDTYDSLFIEDDRVSLYFIFNNLKKKKMIVFEEGFGTYRSSYPQSFSFMRKVKWISLSLIKGCGINFGGGRNTDYVLTQYPEVYKKLNYMSSSKALLFSGSSDIFSKYSEFWDNVINKDLTAFGYYQSDSKVALVLGTWGGASNKEVEEIFKNYDFIIYKSHPHDGILLQLDNVHNIEAKWVPAEVYIFRLASKFKNLHVYHYSSSTSFYLDGFVKNVKFIDLLKDSRFLKVVKAKESCNS